MTADGRARFARVVTSGANEGAVASWPDQRPADGKMLVVDPRAGEIADASRRDLASLLAPGDVLIANDAATVPASLAGETAGGAPIELRLAAWVDGAVWKAIAFGEGDWRTPTEARPTPELVARDELRFAGGLRAEVLAVDRHARRLITVRLTPGGDAFWPALYAAAAPVQYAYARATLALWDVQSPFASRPWAVEAPSAGFGLDWALLTALKACGVAIARVTHAAGLSSTGDAALDARLPFDERYEVPPETLGAVARARAGGGRVLAVGTTVVRALEAAASEGRLKAGRGVATLTLGPGSRRRVVDGVMTGVHVPGSSHARLLEAFAPAALLARAARRAREGGYREHEFGDATLVLPGALAAAGARKNARSA